MSSSPAPSGIHQLSQQDRTIKLRKRQQVEQHWHCSIEDAIPPALRPRSGAGPKTAKAKIGEHRPEAEWWCWSVDFFYKLENLASMTPGRLAFAQALMQAEVSERQKNYTARNRETAELMKTDLMKIIEELRERKTMGQDDSSGSDEDDEESGDEEAGDDVDDEHLEEDEEAVANATAATGVRRDTRATELLEQAIKTEPDTHSPLKHRLLQAETLPAKRHELAPFQHATQAHASKEVLETKANIASLRAAAARLRQQASQREAKAYKLEAEMWEREAGEGE